MAICRRNVQRNAMRNGSNPGSRPTAGREADLSPRTRACAGRGKRCRAAWLLRQVVLVEPGPVAAPGLEIDRVARLAGFELHPLGQAPFARLALLGGAEERGDGLDRRRLIGRVVFLADRLGGV